LGKQQNETVHPDAGQTATETQRLL
jgi:hypothetical protein